MTEDIKYGPLFFLGAGASVAAGVPATFELVDCFFEELEGGNESKKLNFLRKLVATLEESELGKNGVDVELLLEALNQLESESECIPLKFFERGKCILGHGYKSEATELRNKLQDFIKKKGLVTKNKIHYLKDLLMFTEADPRPLDIFSVNYDICIEQFCDAFEKTYTDGFYLDWEPKALEREDFDIRLYKIHGSIIWYETDKGSLVKLPIKSEAAEIELITGEKASSLMLYPMKKLEYSEPLMSLLTLLRDKLSKSDFVFIIGYSFRDNQLRRTFWNAAKKNKELVLFLVSPSAHQIYENRLRKYNTELGIPSDLDGRVICLPYKFEKVLPLLSEYRQNAANGLRMVSEYQKSETLRYQDTDWGRCLPSLINCEHTAKIEEILKKGAWETYVKNTPETRLKIELAFRAFLTSLISGDAAYRKGWFNRFYSLFSSLVEPVQFEAGITLVSTERIGVRIDPCLAGENTISIDKINEISTSMLAMCSLKSALVKEDSTEDFSGIAQGIKKLSGQFSKRSLSINEYIDLRKNSFPAETDKISLSAEKYLRESKKTYPEDIVTTIPKLVIEIEKEEFSANLASLKFILEKSI